MEKLHSVTYLQRLNVPLVFTSGCFDLLHPGHITFLSLCRVEAMKHGGRLVVGVNSDASVKLWKGKYPIFNTQERLKMLASLTVISSLITFNERTPTQLVRELKPVAVVHGHSKERPAWESSEELDGYEGEVTKIPIQGVWSSTRVLEQASRKWDEISAKRK